MKNEKRYSLANQVSLSRGRHHFYTDVEDVDRAMLQHSLDGEGIVEYYYSIAPNDIPSALRTYYLIEDTCTEIDLEKLKPSMIRVTANCLSKCKFSCYGYKLFKKTI